MTAMTAEEAVAHVLANDPTFAIADTEVRGVTVKAFQNIPATVPALLPAGWERQGNGAFEYLAFEGESWTYAEFTASVCRLAHALRDD